jgi:S-ribosylhomocysteine lyase LuxS involved in autoinducer biosynthesis
MRVYRDPNDQKVVVDWAPRGVKKGQKLNVLDTKNQCRITKILNHIRDNH